MLKVEEHKQMGWVEEYFFSESIMHLWKYGCLRKPFIHDSEAIVLILCYSVLERNSLL